MADWKDMKIAERISMMTGAERDAWIREQREKRREITSKRLRELPTDLPDLLADRPLSFHEISRILSVSGIHLSLVLKEAIEFGNLYTERAGNTKFTAVDLSADYGLEVNPNPYTAKTTLYWTKPIPTVTPDREAKVSEVLTQQDRPMLFQELKELTGLNHWNLVHAITAMKKKGLLSKEGTHYVAADLF